MQLLKDKLELAMIRGHLLITQKKEAMDQVVVMFIITAVAAGIICHTLENLFFGQKVIISPCFGFQKAAFESPVRLGLGHADVSILLNLWNDATEQIVEGVCL